MNLDSPNSTLLDYKQSLANNPFANNHLLVCGKQQTKAQNEKLVTQTDHLFPCVHKDSKAFHTEI
jgi:hypothetical protein